MREPIPEWKGFMRSYATDDGRGPPEHVLQIQREIRRQCHERKPIFERWRLQGILSDRTVAVYGMGPMNLPLDCFTSSRWTERRNGLPLPLDRGGWKICWEYWRGSESYRAIKAHIEKHGMRRAVIADWVVNYDPTEGKMVDRAFAFHGENPEWPFLVLRTGNERLMMAMFEWGWKTIPTLVSVRDCGHSPAVTALMRWIVDEGVGVGLARASRGVFRTVDQKGG